MDEKWTKKSRPSNAGAGFFVGLSEQRLLLHRVRCAGFRASSSTGGGTGSASSGGAFFRASSGTGSGALGDFHHFAIFRGVLRCISRFGSVGTSSGASGGTGSSTGSGTSGGTGSSAIFRSISGFGRISSRCRSGRRRFGFGRFSFGGRCRGGFVTASGDADRQQGGEDERIFHSSLIPSKENIGL
jgi:hypothetical protein